MKRLDMTASGNWRGRLWLTQRGCGGDHLVDVLSTAFDGWLRLMSTWASTPQGLGRHDVAPCASWAKVWAEDSLPGGVSFGVHASFSRIWRITLQADTEWITNCILKVIYLLAIESHAQDQVRRTVLGSSNSPSTSTIRTMTVSSPWHSVPEVWRWLWC